MQRRNLFNPAVEQQTAIPDNVVQIAPTRIPMGTPAFTQPNSGVAGGVLGFNPITGIANAFGASNIHGGYDAQGNYTNPVVEHPTLDALFNGSRARQAAFDIENQRGQALFEQQQAIKKAMMEQTLNQASKLGIPVADANGNITDAFRNLLGQNGYYNLNASNLATRQGMEGKAMTDPNSQKAVDLGFRGEAIAPYAASMNALKLDAGLGGTSAVQDPVSKEMSSVTGGVQQSSTSVVGGHQDAHGNWIPQTEKVESFTKPGSASFAAIPSIVNTIMAPPSAKADQYPAPAGPTNQAAQGLPPTQPQVQVMPTSQAVNSQPTLQQYQQQIEDKTGVGAALTNLLHPVAGRLISSLDSLFAPQN